MPVNIGTAGFSPTRPALEVIGGVDGSALGAGIVLEHFLIPLGVSNLFDPVLGFPQLNPVGSVFLECA